MPSRPAAPRVAYAARPHNRLGLVWVALTERGLWVLSYGIDETEFRARILERGPAQPYYDEDACAEALNEVIEYLQGRRRAFTLNVDWRGMTDFQIAVRKAVMAVPYGHTASYGDIAAAVGKPLAARAVGGVQADNPISFIIPCHRIIGADGSLHGYGGFGGLETKAWLLQLESPHEPAQGEPLY